MYTLLFWFGQHTDKNAIHPELHVFSTAFGIRDR